MSTASAASADETQAEPPNAPSWPDDPELPGASAPPPDLPDEAIEPAPSCACEEPRPLAPQDKLGDDDDVALVVRRLEREWSSMLTWRAQPWFRIDPHTTKISIKLSGLKGYEILCSPLLEPIACGAGPHLRGTLSVRTADGLLHFSSAVRVNYGPPGHAIVELDPAAALAGAVVIEPVRRLVLSVSLGAHSSGHLSVTADTVTGDATTDSAVATW